LGNARHTLARLLDNQGWRQLKGRRWRGMRNDLFLKKWAEDSNSFKSDPPNAVLSVSKDKTPPTSTVVVLNNPRLNGNNLTYDVRTLEGDLPTKGIMSTLFIDGSGGDWIKSSASCDDDGDWTQVGGAYRINC
jgi:hypothetical protein